MLTQRTPILPPFYSNWQLSEIEDFPALAVSSVFDLPRFQAETAQIQQSGILEWEDINGVIDPSRETDPSWPEVGCWGGGPLTEEWSMSFAKISESSPRFRQVPERQRRVMLDCRVALLMESRRRQRARRDGVAEGSKKRTRRR